MLRSLDKNLLENERLLFSTKKHVIIFLPTLIFALITLFFYFNENVFLSQFAFLPGIATLLVLANAFLIYISSNFAITDKRIIMKEGIVFRHTNEMRLATIANASVNQSLLGQILNYGTVIIYPFGGGGDPFTLIAKPNEFQKQLQMQLDKITR
jgi:uncharacterized membrane protein YdbT with pleckstrin-like domain